MTYAAEILADSIGPHGHRVTTFRVVFPRFILAEVNTHCMLSRNSASSRAIPPEKMIVRAVEHPFIPETFNARVKGMGVGKYLGSVAQAECVKAWLYARDKAVIAAQVLIDQDVDKSRINRLLEPFLWHTAIITGTELSNFFALRDHTAAQPEFQIIARMMREARDISNPRVLNWGQWHLPLVTDEEMGLDDDPEFPMGMQFARVSAGRCFRVSYDIVTEDELPLASAARTDAGTRNAHWSPLEHPAMVMPESEWAARRALQETALATSVAGRAWEKSIDQLEFSAKLRGFIPLRSMYAAEHDAQILFDAESAAV